jgi:hypothetical protein
MAQQLQVDMMVLRVIEDCLAAIAALRDVVGHALRDDASDSRHFEIECERSRRILREIGI